ncbi:MAG TPA: hypothetical protein VEA59_03730, partial [Patescibacteria group bacterium]|nr:hypothetical protein [Patescibacteria group bacterium]
MKKYLSFATAVVIGLGLTAAANAAMLADPITVTSAYPNIGSTTTVSGNCGTGGANNNVRFSLVRNGQTVD